VLTTFRARFDCFPVRPAEAGTPNLACLKVGILFALCSSLLAQAQTNAPIPLWPDGAPGALGKEDKDIPSLTPFLPSAPSIASGAAIVILPGGGYGALAPHEGQGYADWLVTNGIASFVVKYRLGSQGY